MRCKYAEHIDWHADAEYLNEFLRQSSKRELRRIIENADEEIDRLEDLVDAKELEIDDSKKIIEGLERDTRPSIWMQDKARVMAENAEMKTEVNLLRNYNRSLEEKLQRIECELYKHGISVDEESETNDILFDIWDWVPAAGLWRSLRTGVSRDFAHDFIQEARESADPWFAFRAVPAGTPPHDLVPWGEDILDWMAH